MKRRILLLSALAMLGAATLPAHAADKIIVKIAGMKPDGEPETVGMKLFAKYVMEGTNGKYDVRVFPNMLNGKRLGDYYVYRRARSSDGVLCVVAAFTATAMPCSKW